MLRWGWGGVGWGGAITFMCFAFKVMLRWGYVHDRLWLFDVLLALAYARHATLGWMGWGGVGWLITFKYTSTHTHVMLRYCTFFLHLHTHVMLRYCTFFLHLHTHVMLRYCTFVRLRGQVDCDGSSVRSIRIGPKSHAFSSLIQQWKKDHPRKKKPKSFLLYIRVLGVVQRSDGP